RVFPATMLRLAVGSPALGASFCARHGGLGSLGHSSISPLHTTPKSNKDPRARLCPEAAWAHLQSVGLLALAHESGLFCRKGRLQPERGKRVLSWPTPISIVAKDLHQRSGAAVCS